MPDDLVAIICTRGHDCSQFPDDVKGECVKCGEPIHWRPHVPEPSVKVCLECFMLSDDADVPIEVTRETIEDLIRLQESKHAKETE